MDAESNVTGDHGGKNHCEGGSADYTIWPTNDQQVGIDVINSLEVGSEITLMLDVITSADVIIEANHASEVNGNQEEDAGPTPLEITENNGDMSDMVIESSEEFDDDEPEEGKKTRSRKRTIMKKHWKSETRKRCRQKGEEYEDRRGKVHRKRTIQGQCKGTCTFQCTKNISRDECISIHRKFWTLSDSGKNHFYSKFVVRYQKKTTSDRTK